MVKNVPWLLSWPAVPSLAFPQNLPHGFRGCLRTFVCSVFTSASCRHSAKQQMQQVHHGQNVPWSLSWPAVPSLAFPQNLPHGFRGCLRTFVCSVFTSASCRLSPKQQMQQVHHGQNVPWSLSWPAVPSLAFPQNLPHGFRGCLRTFVCSVFTSASCRHSPKQQMQQVHHGQNVPWSLSWPAVPSLAFPQNLPHGFRGCLRTFVCSVFTSASCRHSPKQQMQQVHHGQNVPWSLSWPAVPSLAFRQNLPHGFRGSLRTFVCTFSPVLLADILSNGKCSKFTLVKTFLGRSSWPAVSSLAFPQNLPLGFRGCLRTFVCSVFTSASCETFSQTANAASSPWSKRSLVAELACCAEPRVSAEFAARLQRLFEDLRVQCFHQCFLQTFSQTANAASSPWSKRSLVAELACCAEPHVSAEFAARLQRLFEDLRAQRFHQSFLQTFFLTANAASSPWSKRSLVAELACCAEPRVSAEFAARLQRLFEDFRVQCFHQCFLQTFSQTANAASSPWSKRSLVAELACCAEPRVSAEFAARLQRLFEDLRVQCFHQCFLQTFCQTANAASSPWSKRSLVAELACCAEPRVSAEFAARLQRLFEDLRVQRFHQCFLQTHSPKQQMQQVHHGQNVPWLLSWPAVPSLAFPQNLPHGFRGCLRTFVCSVFKSASWRHSAKQQMQQVHHGQNVPWSLSWPAVPSLAFPQNLPHGGPSCAVFSPVLETFCQTANAATMVKTFLGR